MRKGFKLVFPTIEYKDSLQESISDVLIAFGVCTFGISQQ